MHVSRYDCSNLLCSINLFRIASGFKFSQLEMSEMISFNIKLPSLITLILSRGGTIITD